MSVCEAESWKPKGHQLSEIWRLLVSPNYGKLSWTHMPDSALGVYHRVFILLRVRIGEVIMDRNTVEIEARRDAAVQ